MSGHGLPREEPPAATPEWRARRERGSLLWLRFMCALSLKLGRQLTRPIVYGIAAYFLLVAVDARRASRRYLERVLERQPTWGERYGHILAFATTIHDRVFFLNNRADLFDIRVSGSELFQGTGSTGALLFGGHLGSFEVLHALARERPELAVSLAMYPENARNIHRILGAINPAAQQDIIALGTVDAMLTVRDRLEGGGLVGLLADRSLGRGPSVALDFLGAPARFPLGPFRMAALLRCPVYFMAALYQGGNRYDVHFELLCDFAEVQGGRGEAALAAVGAYAATLARYCRLGPCNWFNFYEFWDPAPP